MTNLKQKSNAQRDKMGGFSKSELKAKLKHKGFKISRTFFKDGCVAVYRNRYYRFRHWGDWYVGGGTFYIDVSEVRRDFDRWANSTENVLTFQEFCKEFDIKR